MFFFKQKTAYEMRISDWSSDVCSSDLTKVNTIRFYEDIGLLPPAARTASGRRSYGPEDVRRLAFIRSARGLGFSIDEIRSLKALAAGPEQDCAEVRALAARHLLDVDERLERMVRLRAELARIVQLCEGGRLARSEERSAGKGGVGTGCSRWSQET